MGHHKKLVAKKMKIVTFTKNLRNVLKLAKLRTAVPKILVYASLNIKKINCVLWMNK